MRVWGRGDGPERRALHAGSWRLKRAFETVAAVVALLLLAPLCLICAVTIRLSSPGPVLIRQRRVGLDGRPFKMLKFRTMQVNADSDTTWSIKNDERITAFGRLLRRTNVDEIPQLLNVVRGEMTLVGPRPERPYFVQLFEKRIPDYTERLRVPPGITGWAQVNGLRGDTSIHERVRLDNDYIDRWSIKWDFAILVRTAAQMGRALFAKRDRVILESQRFGPVAVDPVGDSAEMAVESVPEARDSFF